MKRAFGWIAIVSVMLVLAVSLPCFGIGTEPETPEKTYRVPKAAPFDESLVAYYNFEGATREEQFADKAPSGLTDDALFATENAVASDGAVFIPSTKGEYLSVKSLEGDTSDLNGKTFYLEFSTSGLAERYAVDLLSANKTFRFWLNRGSSDTNYLFGGGITSKPTVTGYKLNSNGDAPTEPAKQWYYLALTLETTSEMLRITSYHSADGTAYVSTVTEFSDGFKPENLIRTAELLIGKCLPTVDDRGLSFRINQLRIYDKVLNASEVGTLSRIVPGNAELLPEETTEAPVVPDIPSLPALALYDENLVAYYNFEGDSDVEKVYDKAPMGKTKDSLSFSNVKINNGVAYISSAKGSYLSIDRTDGDTGDLNGKTIYLKFNAMGNADTYANDLISAYGTVRYWMNRGSTDGNFTFGGGIGHTPTVKGYQLASNSGAPRTPSGNWYYVALTFELTEEALNVKTYQSADGKNYVETVNVFADTFRPEHLIREEALTLGKVNKTVGDRGLSFYIDDFRIYDRLMTADEIKNLVYIVPGEKTVLPAPETTETTELPPTVPQTTSQATDGPAEPTSRVTEESTVSVPQSAETPSSPEVTSEIPETKPTEPAEDGCNSAVTVSFGLIVLTGAAAVLLIRKKERD